MKFVFAAICIFTCGLPFSHAETVELEGTLTAVNADARTISVERETTKGTKTLEFEVNKNAGDLLSMKVGDRITFSYDPDLELVTKLAALAAVGNESEKKLLRFSVAISANGEVTVELAKNTDAEAADSSAGDVVRTKQEDGCWKG